MRTFVYMLSLWNELSETSPAAINDYLLQEGGERYRMHDPSICQHQVKLVHEGRWDELKAWQTGSGT